MQSSHPKIRFFSTKIGTQNWDGETHNKFTHESLWILMSSLGESYSWLLNLSATGSLNQSRGERFGLDVLFLLSSGVTLSLKSPVKREIPVLPLNQGSHMDFPYKHPTANLMM